MIVIVDYGMGNLGSISNMLKKIGAKNVISSKAEDIESAERLILPGVGAFDNAIKNIRDMGLWDVLDRAAGEGTPILGICLGMQLLSKKSEEGTLEGFGWVNAETVKFRSSGNGMKIPHMGWNTIKIEREDGLLRGLDESSRFYFVHSYHVACCREDTLARTNYGCDFTSVLRKGNVMGVQFHPERSHRFGMQLLRNFSEGSQC